MYIFYNFYFWKLHKDKLLKQILKAEFQYIWYLYSCLSFGTMTFVFNTFLRLSQCLSQESYLLNSEGLQNILSEMLIFLRIILSY